MKAYISELIREAVAQIAPTEAGSVLGVSTFDVSYPKPGFGDYATNAAMVLFKQFTTAPAANPAALATLLAGAIKKLDHNNTFASVQPAEGFINFTLSETYLISQLQKIITHKDSFGSQKSESAEKVLLEYFQPNVAKPLHLGHLENGIFGDALFRLLTFTGVRVESDTHLGDWGTQFGLLLLAYKKWGDIEVIKTNPIVELNKLYVQINTQLETEPELREAGKQEFVKLEQGDDENIQLWNQFKDWSWQEFEIMYADVGIRKADHNWPESFYADKMPAVVSALKDKGLLKESQGAQIVDLESYGLGVAIITKSDGGTTYLLRDLATYIYRKAHGFSKQLYVVDVRQSHTLAQTFKILELLGNINSSQEAAHIAYGFMTLPEGAMSTRKGTIVGAKELIEDAIERASEIIEEKNPSLENKIAVAKMVANAAIKYFILSRNLKNDIVFEREKALSFEGNTGPYLQYTHARIHGILRKGNIESVNNIEQIPGVTPEELVVLRKLNQFPEIVAYAAREYIPTHLCTYLFELSQNFNTFYQAVTVLSEEDEAKRTFRLGLIAGTAQVLKNGLTLLGIDAPEQM